MKTGDTIKAVIGDPIALSGVANMPQSEPYKPKPSRFGEYTHEGVEVTWIRNYDGPRFVGYFFRVGYFDKIKGHKPYMNHVEMSVMRKTFVEGHDVINRMITVINQLRFE